MILSRNNWKLLICIIMSACNTALADQYSDDIAQSEQFLTNYINHVRAGILQYGSPQVIDTDMKVRFAVENTPFPAAYTMKNPQTGQDEIRISPSYRLIITYIADVDTFGAANPEFGMAGCAFGYYIHLHNSISEKMKNVLDRLGWSRVAAPEEYFATSSSFNCRRYASNFPIAEVLRPQRDVLVNNLVGFTYLHELGHIAKSHPFLPIDYAQLDDKTSPKEKAAAFSLLNRSRDQEYEADDWAVHQFVEMGTDPWALLGSMGYFVAFGGHDCSSEEGDTHPNGFQRFSHLASYLREQIVKTKKPLTRPVKDFDSIISETDALAKKARGLLKCITTN